MIHPTVARVYDLVMTHKLDTDDFFIHRVQQHCAELGLNFFLLEPTWIEPFLQRFQKGEVWARAVLNMHSEHHQPEDLVHQFILLAHERKSVVIDPPHTALNAFNKATLHPQLIHAGIHVPYTLIIPQDQTDTFQLTDTQKAELGSPFVIKPARGYGRQGVILDATQETDLQRSRKLWPDQSYLLQKKLSPRLCGDWPGYFRVYYAFGKTWCNWWNCFTDGSRRITPEERESFQLAPLESIIQNIAQLTGMRFFSSEILLTEDQQFVVIDYVNDQCHMLSQSAHPQIGVPDAVVAEIAAQLVQSIRSLIR